MLIIGLHDMQIHLVLIQIYLNGTNAVLHTWGLHYWGPQEAYNILTISQKMPEISNIKSVEWVII